MNLWTESLWGDEGFSALAVQKDFWPMIGVVMKDTSPPLFYLVGYIWGRLFGFSEISLRSLTLLLMAGAAIFAGLIVSRIDKSRLKALLTTGLVFASPFLLPFAFEWRMYALLTFMVTGATYFFVSKKWWGYIWFALGAVYTHHFAVFTIFAHGIWFLLTEFSWREPKKWLKQLAPFLWIGLGYSFWLYPMYVQIQRVKGSGFWLGVPKVGDLTDLLYRFLTGGIIKDWRLPVAVLAGICLIGKDWRRVGRVWFSLLWIFSAPIVISYFLSQVITPIFYDRYLLSAVVGSGVLLVLGTKNKFLPAAGIVFVIYALGAWQIFNHPTKRPFREFTAFVKTQIKTDDYLINYNGRAHHIWESKYYGLTAPIYTPNDPLPLYVGTALMDKNDTVTVLPDKKRVGVIASEDPKDITIPGRRTVFVKQFGELRFMWLEKIK